MKFRNLSGPQIKSSAMLHLVARSGSQKNTAAKVATPTNNKGILLQKKNSIEREKERTN
jgi:hypothetical protein